MWWASGNNTVRTNRDNAIPFHKTQLRDKEATSDSLADSPRTRHPESSRRCKRTSCCRPDCWVECHPLQRGARPTPTTVPSATGPQTRLRPGRRNTFHWLESPETECSPHIGAKYSVLEKIA